MQRRLWTLVVAAALAGAVLTGAFAAVASGGLPAEGTWLYEVKTSTKKVVTFQAYVNVAPEKSSIYTLRGALIGTCKKNGVSRPYSFVDFNIRSSFDVNSDGSFVDFNIRSSFDVSSDGSFSANRRSSGGVKGSAKVKGVIDGTRMTGKVTARQRSSAWGKCKARGKFRAKGELIG